VGFEGGRERAACFVSFYRGFKRVKVFVQISFLRLVCCLGLPLYIFFVFIFILSLLSYSFSFFLFLCFIILILLGTKSSLPTYNIINDWKNFFHPNSN
jgi:glucan phosphoethanolaminetransferase (alkaline phosphatase superfamily)